MVVASDGGGGGLWREQELVSKRQKEISFAQQIHTAVRYKLSGCVCVCVCVCVP